MRSINGGGSVTSDISHSELVSGGGIVQGNGLGSLADELADAWDEDEEGEEGDMSMDDPRTNVKGGGDGLDERDGDVWMNGQKDVKSSPTLQSNFRRRRGPQRKGTDSDDDEEGDGEEGRDAYAISPSLEARMGDIERLARKGIQSVRDHHSNENQSEEKDGVMNRMVHALRDLGGQAGLEGVTTRSVSFHLPMLISISFFSLSIPFAQWN